MKEKQINKRTIERLRYGIAAFAVMAIMSMVLVGTASASTVCDSGCDYTTIQDAIDAANDGDTINVAAGTYHNDIVDGHWEGTVWVYDHRIDKSVTLLGAQAGNDPLGSTDRTGETILTRSDGLPYSITAPNVIIDGFMNGDSTPNSGGRFIIGDDADGTTIKNCIIQNTPDGSSGHGVNIDPGATGATITHNTISNTAWEAIRCDGAAVISGNTIKDIPTNKGIYLGATSDAQVIDNVISNTFYEGIQACGLAEITGNDISGYHIGIQIRDSAAGTIIDGNNIHGNTYEGIQAFVPAIITNNEISGNANGIQIRDHATGTTITGNYIYDNTYHGLEIPNYGGAEPVAEATITGNTFANNGYTGIKMGGGAEGFGISIHHNCFNGNGIFGVESQTTDSNVNAVNNWWSDSSGPGGVGPGTGDAASSMVDYNPWLTMLYSGVTTFSNLDSVILQATLGNSDTTTLFAGETVEFYINDAYFGSATIDANGVATLDVGLKSVGVYDIRAASSSCCMETSALIAVYDPSAGFVTGGGWIDSPEGAYYPDTSLSGKANFGFVSKYKKGADTPDGTTQFQFKVADFNFQSESYDWLVIAGARAQYKGTGTINGVGNYGFMLTAIDEALTPSTDVDLFRIKIWEELTEDIVYDNNLGVSDTGDAATALGGGSIIIHKAK